MSYITKTIAMLASAAVLAGSVGAFAQDEVESINSADTFNIPENISILGRTDLGLRKATALVNGTIITGTDIDQRVALQLAAADVHDIPPEEMQALRLQVLRNLIDETLQIQEAKAQEMEVTPEEVDESYARIASERFNETSAALDTYLSSVGSSPGSLKRQLEGQMAWDRLLRRNVAPFVQVSASEVNELYDRMIASRGQTEYRIGEIFLSANAANRTAVGENARRIVEQLRQGASFVDFARRFSEASTASVGGDLGWIKLEQLQNQQLEQVAQGLQTGQLVGPIEIPGGFSILYLIDKRQIGMANPRDAVLSLKQISLDFPAGTAVETARARATAFAEAVDKIHGCGEADAAAAAMGAEIITNDQLPVRSLPEALQSTMLQLSIGQTTPLIGSLEDGVRVLMLCGRDDPSSEAGPDRETLASSLEDDRVNKRAQRYLRDLRRDAVIEYN